MIRIFLGNVGSGKTACAVRDMYINGRHRVTYSNIITTLGCQIDINPSMIVKREQVDTKQKRSGETIPIYEYTLNIEYWKEIIKKEKAINVIIDEAHSVINARRAMSKINVIMSDWLALIRRVLGSTTSGAGELTFITQFPRKLDINAREMATQVRYHVCHYNKTCNKCGFSWRETSEMPEPRFVCPACGSEKVQKHNHIIEVWHFSNIDGYEAWRSFGMQTHYRHYLINDIEHFFPLYNTLQWDNLFSKLYQ